VKSGQEIYETFLKGDIAPLEAAQQLVIALAKEFDDEAHHLERAQTDMMQYWEGDSSDAAGRGVVPLIQANSESVPMIIEAGGSVQGQSEVYSWGKQNVEPVPAEPKEPSIWAKGAGAILPGVPDPDVAYREGMARHEAANANNVRVMDQYTNVTGDTSSKLPSDYGIVEDDGASISIGTHASSVGPTPGVGTPGVGSAGFTPGGGSGPGINVPGGGPSFGGGPGPGIPGGGPSTGGPGPGPVPPGGGPGPGPAPAPRPGPGLIAPIGPVTGSPGDDSRRPARGGARGPAGSSRAGARMTGGSTGTGAGSGKATSVLRGGAAAQARLTGGTAGLQAGKGAGGLPGAGAGGAAAAKAASGIGGRAGAGGMGAAGAGGARGKGEEDGEHKDKYAIKEELDDGLTVEYDELGAKTIDEKTGNTVVSPVIGEPDAGK
jgi:hypothetical protein